MNLTWRYPDESQRALLAARLTTLSGGQRNVGTFADGPTQAEAADMLKISERTVRSAREGARADVV